MIQSQDIRCSVVNLGIDGFVTISTTYVLRLESETPRVKGFSTVSSIFFAVSSAFKVGSAFHVDATHHSGDLVFLAMD